MPSMWLDTLPTSLDAVPFWAMPVPADVEAKPVGAGGLLLIDSRGADNHEAGAVLMSALDMEFLIKFRTIRPATTTYQLGSVGLRLRELDSDNYLEIRAGSGASHLLGNIRERLVANTNDTQVPALWTGADGTWRFMRVQVSGTQVKVRGWVQGAAEPGTWAITHTLAATPTAGNCRFMHPYARGGVTEVAYVAIATSGAAPTGPTRVISGNVVDALEQGVSRKVIALRRDTGRKVAETTSAAITGAYSLAVEDTGEYTLVVLDDALGVLENDYAERVLL